MVQGAVEPVVERSQLGRRRRMRHRPERRCRRRRRWHGAEFVVNKTSWFFSIHRLSGRTRRAVAHVEGSPGTIPAVQVPAPPWHRIEIGLADHVQLHDISGAHRGARHQVGVPVRALGGRHPVLEPRYPEDRLPEAREAREAREVWELGYRGRCRRCRGHRPATRDPRKPLGEAEIRRSASRSSSTCPAGRAVVGSGRPLVRRVPSEAEMPTRRPTGRCVAAKGSLGIISKWARVRFGIHAIPGSKWHVTAAMFDPESRTSRTHQTVRQFAAICGTGRTHRAATEAGQRGWRDRVDRRGCIGFRRSRAR